MIYSNNNYYLQLAREYPKTLLRPSNVFTIDNPDILVLNDCGLWGIFIPTKAELEDIALLIRRATASRLAYSAQMKTVLVAVADINPIFTEEILNLMYDFIMTKFSNKLHAHCYLYSNEDYSSESLVDDSSSNCND